MASLPILTTNEVTVTGLFAQFDGHLQPGPYLDPTRVRCAQGQTSARQAVIDDRDPGEFAAQGSGGRHERTLLPASSLGRRQPDRLYAALYELTDVELVESLVEASDKS